MKGSCRQPNCFFSDGGCKLGNEDLNQCEYWQGLPPTETAPVSDAAEEPGQGVPWTGLALGRADLVDVAVRGRPILIGIVGPADSGKTTFLVGLYLMLLQGHQLAESTFAGSLTLEAWESLAGWMRWTELGRPPTFPPHTSSRNDRQPGLLHLALRLSSGQRRDILFTDAPGEWFTRWALKADAPDAEGARWVAERADGFLLFADCKRLAGPDFGAGRQDLRSIMARMGPVTAQRPVGIVWAKSDIPVKEVLVDAITKNQRQYMSAASFYEASIKQPEKILHAASSVVSAALKTVKVQPLSVPILDHRPFFAFRGPA